MAHYIVTGGAGFIGSHLVDLLISEGHRVRVLDNLSTGSTANLNSGAELRVVDLTRPQGLEDILRGADGVFHFAALPRIEPSFHDPIGHDNANTRATLHLVRAMKEAGVGKLVLSSSSSIYGDAVEIPTTESCPISPLSPYALQKYASERYALLLAPTLGIGVNALRYFNVYGPRSYNPSNPLNAYSSVVGIFANRVREGLPIDVTWDGGQERDFVHVYDVARVNYVAMRSKVWNEYFNVGTGRTWTISAIAAMYTKTWNHLERRPGEARITHADISKARNLLGWSPAVALDDAVARGIV